MIAHVLIAAWQISPTIPAPVHRVDDEILVTASLSPVRVEEGPLSAALLDEATIDALGLTFAADLARLAPGVSVATTGAHGTETVVRIRGAESNHTLLFLDGIAFNDVAAANAARFDTLTTGNLARMELIRGPQSALWGSEALGGVVALSSPEPLGRFRLEGTMEAGSRNFREATALLASGGDRAGLSLTGGFARSDGIDIVGGGGGDRDGFENLSLGAKAVARSGPWEVGGVGRFIHHDVEFDGVDPLTFQRADTEDASTAETFAVRGWAGFDDGRTWSARIEAQRLDSENRNEVGRLRTADSRGHRTRFGGRLGRHLRFSGAQHELMVAVEREEERFANSERAGGAPQRRLDRSRTAYVAEWRANWSGRLIADVALRHDDFNRFADSTTARLHLSLDVGRGVQVVGGYGEGIAQPSFTDLFGFPGFPFVGNPALRPERSRGLEAGLRFRNEALLIETILHSSTLEDEIVEDFSVFPSTVVNSTGKSRRRGLELSMEWQPVRSFFLSANYSWLDTHERDPATTLRQQEIRRPRHSANAFARWHSGRFTLGGSLSYVGPRLDRDFDLFPAPVVTLDDYVLGSARIAFALLPQVELFGRIENAFDARYQDVFGYATPGRSVHAGLRLTPRR